MTKHVDLLNAFSHVLGNTCRISRTAQSYAWNVTGAKALEAEACFHTQADEMHLALNPLAEHMLGMDGVAILDYSDEVLFINPPTASNLPQLEQMVATLVNGHGEALHSIGAAMDLARDVDEIPSVHLLASRIEAHRRHKRRLSLLG